ncbi:uncharacterized protein LOC109509752 isoform X1 [Arapaima gigas]
MEDADPVCKLCKKKVVCSSIAMHESQCQQLMCLHPEFEDPVPCEQMDQHCEVKDRQGELMSMEPQAPRSLPLEDTSENSPGQAPLATPVTHRQTLEACWYCLKSLPPDPDQPKEHQLDSASPPGPHGDKGLDYQQDPRPHFGVPRSSRSTALPLWGNKGPAQGTGGPWAELQEEPTAICPHCHLALPLDTLRWHEVHHARRWWDS